MKAKLTTIVKAAEEGGYWAICPEVPGANGQGETIEEAKRSMAQAIEIMTEDQRLNSLLTRITTENQHTEIESEKKSGNK